MFGALIDLIFGPSTDQALRDEAERIRREGREHPDPDVHPSYYRDEPAHLERRARDRERRRAQDKKNASWFDIFD